MINIASQIPESDNGNEDLLTVGMQTQDISYVALADGNNEGALLSFDESTGTLELVFGGEVRTLQNVTRDQIITMPHFLSDRALRDIGQAAELKKVN